MRRTNTCAVPLVAGSISATWAPWLTTPVPFPIQRSISSVTGRQRKRNPSVARRHKQLIPGDRYRDRKAAAGRSGNFSGTICKRGHSFKAGISGLRLGGQVMRKIAFVFAALFIIPTSGFSQSIQIGPGGVRVDDGRGRGQCEELRRACENKDRLGEQGEGNCRRYREACQRPVRRDVCGELRAACLNKDQLGEQGEGNCRRYRQTCRGR
jgi:hypothetical protein